MTIADRTVTIRPATVDDAELVLAMVCEIAAHEGSLDDVHTTVDDWRRLLARPEVTVLLAVDGDDTLGYVSAVRRLNLWMAGDILALDDLYVREHARNHGVGRRLMTAIARHAAPEQLLIVWGARADNEDGHRFYRRLGAHLTIKATLSWAPNDYAWAAQ